MLDMAICLSRPSGDRMHVATKQLTHDMRLTAPMIRTGVTAPANASPDTNRTTGPANTSRWHIAARQMFIVKPKPVHTNLQNPAASSALRSCAIQGTNTPVTAPTTLHCTYSIFTAS